jgi:hypothetical protein
MSAVHLTQAHIDAITAALDERAVTLNGRIERAKVHGDPENLDILKRYVAQLADVESALALILAASA